MDLRANSPILIAGASGMVGRALVRHFQRLSFSKLLTPSRGELNLLDQSSVLQYLKTVCPEVVIIAAARVGGIWANATYPAEFLYENLMMASNIIHGAHLAGVQRLLFLGSSCIYPREALQPIKEEALLTGALEPTNEAYAVAKIAGVKLVEAYAKQYGRSYISAMPTNLYGPGDRYHPKHSHVIAALILRFHEAKQNASPTVTIWGSGTPLREFLYVDDLAEAIHLILERYEGPGPINIGSCDEVSIRGLAEHIGKVVGYSGELVFDASYPDGTPRKRTDTSKLAALGWRSTTSLQVGLEHAYADFLKHHRLYSR